MHVKLTCGQSVHLVLCASSCHMDPLMVHATHLPDHTAPMNKGGIQPEGKTHTAATTQCQMAVDLLPFPRSDRELSARSASSAAAYGASLRRHAYTPTVRVVSSTLTNTNHDKQGANKRCGGSKCCAWIWCSAGTCSYGRVLRHVVAEVAGLARLADVEGASVHLSTRRGLGN